ncbi:MAG: cell wall hydrolase [Lachnospiraceae bacterium]
MNLKKRVIEGGVVAVSVAILTAVTSISGTVAQATPSTLLQDAKSAEDTKKNVATIERKSVNVVTADAVSAGFQADANAIAAAENVSESEEPSVGVGVNAQSAVIVAQAQSQKEEENEPASVSVGVNADAAATVASAQEKAADEALADTTETQDDKGKAEQKTFVKEEEKEEKDEKKDAEDDVWQNRLMADVDQSLNVRASADENSEIVGKLYKGALAEAKEVGDTWTHIVSGNVDGYVKNDYCVIGKDAEKYAKDNFDTCATVSTEVLRIRSEADEDATILDVAKEGEKLVVHPQEEQKEDGWVKVEYQDGKDGYVSSDFVTVDLDLTRAVTIEEENARIKAEEEKKAAEEAAKAAEEAAKSAAKAANSSSAAAPAAPQTTQSAPASASADETALLGAVIQLEAGGESYEGQVAVGAVVMNRVRSGAYPNSISGVIYQPGQFSTAGGVASLAASGVSGSCMQAAQAAINGANNVGGAMSFRRVSSGCQGLVIGNHVFF